jgi:hypothetical protein
MIIVLIIIWYMKLQNYKEIHSLKIKTCKWFLFHKGFLPNPCKHLSVSHKCRTPRPPILLHLTNRIIAKRCHASIIVARRALAELHQTLYKLTRCSEIYVMQASREIESSSSSTVLRKVPILELENSGYHAMTDRRLQTVFIWFRTGQDLVAGPCEHANELLFP